MSKGLAMMDAEFFECVEVAEKEHDIGFLIKGNALKDKSDQTKEDILKLENQIAELQTKKRKLNSCLIIYHDLLIDPEAFCCACFSVKVFLDLLE